MHKQTQMSKRCKYSIQKAFKELGDIDKKHESGKFTKKQHDTKSRMVLRKLVKCYHK